MANYNCTIRSNYFHVKDETEFEAFMNNVYGAEDDVQMWKEKDKAGNAVYGFGCLGGILGFCDTEDDDPDYGEFLVGLQQHICPDDAIIIMEAGHEKLRYVVGCATILTHNGSADLDITSLAVEKAAEMLERKDFKTRCDY